MNEKEIIEEIHGIKKQIEATRVVIEQAERESDLERAARLQYGTLRELEKKLEQKEARLEEIQQEGGLLKEEVDAEEIAGVVSPWMGIPALLLSVVP